MNLNYNKFKSYEFHQQFSSVDIGGFKVDEKLLWTKKVEKSCALQNEIG